MLRPKWAPQGFFLQLCHSPGGGIRRVRSSYGFSSSDWCFSFFRGHFKCPFSSTKQMIRFFWVKCGTPPGSFGCPGGCNFWCECWVGFPTDWGWFDRSELPRVFEYLYKQRFVIGLYVTQPCPCYLLGLRYNVPIPTLLPFSFSPPGKRFERERENKKERSRKKGKDLKDLSFFKGCMLGLFLKID